MSDRIFTACCVSCRGHAAASDRRSLDAIGWCLLATTDNPGETLAFCPRCLASRTFLVVVSRDARDRLPLLTGACQGKPISVTLDRRVGERRSSPAAGPPGRRAGDRRACATDGWPACGWMAFEQRPARRGPLGC